MGPVKLLSKQRKYYSRQVVQAQCLLSVKIKLLLSNKFPCTGHQVFRVLPAKHKAGIIPF